jgi:enoyl-CoA hydratase/carnithine racemase
MSAVTFETKGTIALIGLNRPEKLNAINDDVLDGLLDAVARLGREEAPAAAVLFGHGRAFSAGGDIKAMDAMVEATFAATIGKYMRVAGAFRACPKPIIAAVHGYALAGGFELALIADVRLAAAGTAFGLPDIPLGLSPTSGMTYLLPRIVGLGRALHLTLSAESIDAAEAERIGLVSRVVAPDCLMMEAEAYARGLAAYPRVGVANTKAGLHGALDGDFASARAFEHAAEVACFRDPDVRQRFRDFLNRKRRSSG